MISWRVQINRLSDGTMGMKIWKLDMKKRRTTYLTVDENCNVIQKEIGSKDNVPLSFRFSSWREMGEYGYYGENFIQEDKLEKVGQEG